MVKDTISAHQTGAIAGIILFALKMTALPSLIYKYNGTGSIIAFVFVIILNTLFLWLVVWIKLKYPMVSLYDIFKSKLGIFVTKLLYLIFFVFFFLKLLLMISDGYTFIKDVADDEFTIFKMFLCFLPIIATLAYSGIRNIGRTSEFFLPFIIVTLVFAVAFSVIPMDSWSIGCLTIKGASGFFSSLFKLSFWTGDLFALVIFLDKIEIKKGKAKEVFFPFLIMAIILVILYILYYSLYQETSQYHVNLLYDVVQYAIGTSKGWHMDFFAIVVFMINIYLQGAVLLYCANECLQKLINYKYNVISLSVIIVFLCIADFLYLNDYFKYITFAEEVLCYFSAVTIVLVPLLLLILAIVKKEKINGKT